MKKMFCLALFAVTLVSFFACAENPDYGSIPAEAWEITPDGTIVQGVLESPDEDWFVFTPTVDTLYRVTLSGEINKGYKEMAVYQIDEFGNLHQPLYFYVSSNGVAARTFFMEAGDDVYIIVYSNPGGYSFYVETLGQYPPDSYADTCGSATGITVNAAPVSGTLTHNPDDSLEVDWFTFDTQPMHMYQINLTKSDNTNLDFQVYDENCEYVLGWSKSHTVTSWFGESYRIHVAGNAVYLGTYYTLEVIDLGLFSDDYSNVHETAHPISPNGSIVAGEIEFSSSYNSDQDWFTFTPTANTLYRVHLTGEAGHGYKEMVIYQIDEFGTLHETLYYYISSDGVSERTFFMETTDDVYIKMYSNLGGYEFYVETLGQYPPDSYADTCAEATPIVVDAEPLEGTLTHNQDGSLEVDWFVFDTQPLHVYQINLTKSDNTNLDFQVYNNACEYILGWNKSHTVTSWFGESYRLHVAGNAVHLGTYYTLEVIDLGLFPDDYPNISADAASIPKDGTPVEGEIQFTSSYHSDEDWFTFVAGQEGDYHFMLTGEVGKGYKEINIYWEDELGVLRHKKYTYIASDGVANFSVHLPAGNIYVQMFSNLGGYRFSVVSPEPRCGDLDHPYPPGDANKDCYVDFEDIAMTAAHWLTCTNPNPPCTE